MTSYAAMAQRGREEARERTAGHRKVIAVRLDQETVETARPNVRALPSAVLLRAPVTVYARLWGDCGHLIACAEDGTPAARRLLDRVGHRVTCLDDGCRIPPHVESDADCEYIMGAEVERRCTTRWRWETPLGKVCTRHRNHYLREGYLTQAECTPAPGGWP